MMKKSLFILCSLLFLTTHSQAKGPYRIAVGPTISSFVNTQNSNSKTGVAIEISRKYQLHGNLGFSVGLGYSTRGAVLENRTIAPYASEPTDAFYQDIHGMLGYLEIPTTIQYEFSVSKKIKFKPFLGPIFTLPIKDLTKFEKKKFFQRHIPHQSDPLLYDFWFEQESVFTNNITKTGLALGFGIAYEKFGLEFKYVLDRREVYHFDSLSEVRQKMNSLYILFSVNP